MAKRQIGLALDPGLVERIDGARGLVPRAAWIAEACERALSVSAVASGSRSVPVPAVAVEVPSPPRAPDEVPEVKELQGRGLVSRGVPLSETWGR